MSKRQADKDAPDKDEILRELALQSLGQAGENGRLVFERLVTWFVFFLAISNGIAGWFITNVMVKVSEAPLTAESQAVGSSSGYLAPTVQWGLLVFLVLHTALGVSACVIVSRHWRTTVRHGVETRNAILDNPAALRVLLDKCGNQTHNVIRSLIVVIIVTLSSTAIGWIALIRYHNSLWPFEP